MSIARLPFVPSTPTVTLHQLLDHVDKIDSLVAIVAWKDAEGNVSSQVCWTAQTHGRLAIASIACQQVIADELVLRSSK